MNLLELFVKIGVKDEASGKMDSLSSAAIAKGQLMANAIAGAVKAAASAIKGFLESALGSFGEYEQQVGGMQTFFGSAADTVIANSKRAYETAGMSANQYLSSVSGFAMSLVGSVSKERNRVAQQDTAAQERELDAQVSNLQKALAREAALQQRAFQEAYSARQEQLNDELDALRKSLSKQVDERQKALDKEVRAFEKATDAHVKEINREYTEKIKLIDEEKYRRLKAIDEQIDALDRQTEAEQLAQKRREQDQKASDLRREIATAKFQEDREKAQRELSDLLADIEQDDRERERKGQKDALKSERDALNEQYEKRKAQLKEQQSEEIDQYKQSRADQLQAMRDANSAEIAAMREKNDDLIKQQQKANSAILKEMQYAQQDQLQAMQEGHQAQLDALKKSVEAQKAALKEAADDLGGYVEATAEDQKRAAELADIAMRDMADNANKTGSSIESLQYAYQGFAKANYTMLDNLKLGYSGTKEGMQSLLDDAKRVSASYGEMRDFSIDSFADIVEAIHIMQTEMGISGLSVDELKRKMADNDFTMQELSKLSEAWYGNRDSIEAVKQSIESGGHVINDFSTLLGTTALEGSTTYEGALNRVKAAWDNWLISLTDPDWDVAESTRTLMEEVGNAAAIIIPRVSEILKSVFDEIQQHGPEIWESLKEGFLNSLPEEWKTKAQEYVKKFEELVDGVKSFADALSGLASAIDTVLGPFRALGEGIGWASAQIAGTFDDTMMNEQELVRFNDQKVHELLETWSAYPEELRSKFIDADGTLTEAGQNIIDGFMNGAEGKWDEKSGWWTSRGEWIKAHKGPEEYDLQLLVPAGQNVITGFMNGATSTWDERSPFFSGLTGTIASFFSGSDSLLTGHGSSIVEGLKSGADSSWGPASAFFGGIPSVITGFFDGSGGWLPGPGADIVNGLSDGFNRIWEGFYSFVSGIPQRIIDAFSGAGSWLVTAGSNIMTGFWNGLTDAWSGVADWISGVGSWIQAHKGPEAYDRKLLVKNGQWIMGSLQDGLRSEFEGEVIPYVSSMADSMSDAFGSPMLSPVASSIGRAGSQQAQQAPAQLPMLNVILELDRVQFGHLVYQLNGEETQRVGVNLVGGVA